MANSTEPSSSLSFTSSSLISNGSTTQNISPPSRPETGQGHEVISLNKLSSSLEQLLVDSDSEFSDAEFSVEGSSVGVHRCILAARSKFFSNVFKDDKNLSMEDGKPRYLLSDLLPYGNVGYESFLIVLGYLYTGKGKPFPMEVSTCVDNACPHDACGPAISFAVELMYAWFIFQIPELVSPFQLRLQNFVEKALAEDVIPILLVAFRCKLSQLLAQCVDRVARSDLEDVSIQRELPDEVAERIKLIRQKSQLSDDDNTPDVDPVCEKRIKKIHRALDSDDVELVKLLLTESVITLDDACALHYAVAYCDPKVVSEVLTLHMANVNLRNSRGYTVLHRAARRREPSVIVSLLAKGACASELTLDGQSPVSICRRSTRPKDYHAKTEQGKEANKYRICIDVLERETRRNPMAGDPSAFSHAMADDLHMKLLYLENRVAFARLFFPAEAKVAMDIAHVETTAQFTGLATAKGSNGNFREVDLNETPLVQNKRLLSQMQALMKTVELGRRYFPKCSQVLDKIMDEELHDLFYLEKGTPDDQRAKRMRFMEIKEDVQKAFSKDKAENSWSGFSSVSSSSSSKHGTSSRNFEFSSVRLCEMQISK